MGFRLPPTAEDVRWLPDFQGIQGALFLVAAGLSTLSWRGFRRLHQEMQAADAP